MNTEHKLDGRRDRIVELNSDGEQKIKLNKTTELSKALQAYSHLSALFVCVRNDLFQSVRSKLTFLFFFIACKKNQPFFSSFLQSKLHMYANDTILARKIASLKV